MTVPSGSATAHDLQLCTCAECNTDIDCAGVARDTKTFGEYEKEIRRLRREKHPDTGLIVKGPTDAEAAETHRFSTNTQKFGNATAMFLFRTGLDVQIPPETVRLDFSHMASSNSTRLTASHIGYPDKFMNMKKIIKTSFDFTDEFFEDNQTLTKELLTSMWQERSQAAQYYRDGGDAIERFKIEEHRNRTAAPPSTIGKGLLVDIFDLGEAEDQI